MASTHLDGKSPAQFRWNDPDRTEPPTDFLAAEGIQPDESGRADPAQQLDARALADAIGLDIDDALIATRGTRSGARTGDSPSMGDSGRVLDAIASVVCGLNATHVKLGRTLPAQAWYDIAIGRSGIDISLVVNSVEQRVNVQLRIADDKALFSLVWRLTKRPSSPTSATRWSGTIGPNGRRRGLRGAGGDFRDANQQLRTHRVARKDRG